MKINRLLALFSIGLAVFLFSNLSVLADIATPRAKGVQVQTKQDYPDFDFFYCLVPGKRIAGPDGGYETFYEKIEITPLQFSASSPYYSSNTYSDDSKVFLAIKRNSNPKNDSELKSKIISALKNKNGDGIYFFYLNTSVENDRDDSKLYVVYTVESLNDTGVKTSRNFAESVPSRTSTFVYIAGGLFLAGLIIALGLLFIKKSKKK